MLKIDLLPRHFAIARKNKGLIALFVVLLAVTAAVWMFQAKTLTSQIDAVTAQDNALAATLKQVDDYTSKASAKQADLAPIKAKVDFADSADKSGRAYWKAYHAINDYLWEGAQLSQFAITSTGAVTFTVTVKGTVGAGRFLLNILRCPALTGINIGGLPPGGASSGSGPGAPGPGGPPGVPPPPPGAPGMPGMPGAAPAPVSGPPGSPGEILTLKVSGTLTGDYTIPPLPTPSGGATAAGGAAGGPPGMPGAPGPGGPGAAPPGGGPPGPPPPPAAGGANSA